MLLQKTSHPSSLTLRRTLARPLSRAWAWYRSWAPPPAACNHKMLKSQSHTSINSRLRDYHSNRYASSVTHISQSFFLVLTANEGILVARQSYRVRCSGEQQG